MATRIVADPALELGDCVTVNHHDRMDIQVVESFSLPLTGGNVMDVSLRALVLTRNWRKADADDDSRLPVPEPG